MANRFLLVFFLILPTICHAYVGPGIGLGVIGSLLALGSAFFVTLFHFVITPIRRLLGKEKKEDGSGNEDSNRQDNKEEKQQKKNNTNNKDETPE